MIAFAGRVWRLVPEATAPTAPAAAPEGRFHHSGQTAIYASLTPEGAAVAIRRYLSAEGPARRLFALAVTAERIADMRGDAALSVVWQDVRATGAPAPTWAASDRLRRAGAQGMLYSSRSRPDLGHLVLFTDFDRIILDASPDGPGTG